MSDLQLWDIVLVVENTLIFVLGWMFGRMYGYAQRQNEEDKTNNKKGQ